MRTKSDIAMQAAIALKISEQPHHTEAERADIEGRALAYCVQLIERLGFSVVVAPKGVAEVANG